MFVARFIGMRLLSRLSGGKLNKGGKLQALSRLPSLLRLGYALLRDERVPLWQRGLTLSLLALIFSPVDIVGDIPVIGQFWDFSLAVVVLDVFVQRAPAEVVNEHIRALKLEQKISLRQV